MIPRAEAVILVHGLFMTGWDMTVLRRRLLRIGFTTHQFSYPSTRFEPLRNAQDLKNFTDRIDAPVIHFVAHSLGGLVVRHFFHESPPRRPGRIVTLATPHQGSRAAAKLALTACGRAVLRKSLEQGLLGDLPAWNGQREIGAVAGSASIGLGRLFADIAKPNDGTVAVSEALLPNATDNVVLPVAHFGMLLSHRVAKEVGFFLRHGRFKHAA